MEFFIPYHHPPSHLINTINYSGMVIVVSNFMFSTAPNVLFNTQFTALFNTLFTSLFTSLFNMFDEFISLFASYDYSQFTAQFNPLFIDLFNVFYMFTSLFTYLFASNEFSQFAAQFDNQPTSMFVAQFGCTHTSKFTAQFINLLNYQLVIPAAILLNVPAIIICTYSPAVHHHHRYEYFL